MKLTKVPGHFFYQGENGKYYRSLREIEISLETHEQLSEPIDHWEEVDYNTEVGREEYQGRLWGKFLIDKMMEIRRNDPEIWAKIQARAEEIRKERG